MNALILSLFLLLQRNEANVSWYECCNTHTASGQRFNPDMQGAAHKTLPFGTMVMFAYKGKYIVVPIIDRGPFIKGREFDLTRGSARKLGILNKGVARVRTTIL